MTIKDILKHKKILLGSSILLIILVAAFCCLYDRTPPQLEAYAPTVDFGEALAVKEIVFGTDNKSKEVVLKITDVSPDKAALSENDTAITFYDVGDYTVTVTGTDNNNNKSQITVVVSVVDRIPPEFVEADNEAEVEVGAIVCVTNIRNTANCLYVKAVDAAGAVEISIAAITPISDKLTKDAYILKSGTVQFKKTGQYVARITATDKYANSQDCNVVITVVDKTGPQFKNIPKTFKLETGDEAPDYLMGINAEDNKDGDISSKISVDDSQVDYDTPGEYTVTYTIKDSSGNITEDTATVVIKKKAVDSGSSSSASGSGGSGAAGYSSDNSADSGTDWSGGSGEVYITETGAKYHSGSCRYLSKSKIPISRAEAIAQGYEPCKVCKP